MKTEIRLDVPGPPGQPRGAAQGWRAVTRVLRSSVAALNQSCSDLANTLFASDCRLCEAPLLTLSRVPFCAACTAAVLPQAGALCTRCGDALGMESARYAASHAQTECTLCRLAPPAFTRAVACSEYDAELRDLLHLLKFSGLRETAALFGQPLAAAIQKLAPQAAASLLVVPVPLFTARESRRGFNQAELLARAAIKATRRQLPALKLTLAANILQRTRDTKPFFALNPAQRRTQLKGAFNVANAATLLGREVLLVDDIMTTGATARECARVLRHAGAAKVWVVTVAKAQPESLKLHNAPNSSEVALWDLPATTSATCSPLTS